MDKEKVEILTVFDETTGEEMEIWANGVRIYLHPCMNCKNQHCDHAHCEECIRAKRHLAARINDQTL